MTHDANQISEEWERRNEHHRYKEPPADNKQRRPGTVRVTSLKDSLEIEFPNSTARFLAGGILVIDSGSDDGTATAFAPGHWSLVEFYPDDEE